MDKNRIKELLVYHRNKFLSAHTLIKRDIQQHIGGYFRQKEIIIITGVRRCGKSSLMRLIAHDLIKEKRTHVANILYINFEDERFLSFTPDDFENLYECYLELEEPKGMKYFFLDEIQHMRGWEKWANRLYESGEIKVFITGSNASILAPETATKLTGRNRQVVCYPFSFHEFLFFKNAVPDRKSLYKPENRAAVKRLFTRFIKTGGFPEIIKNQDPSLLEQYFNDIIYRDIIARYGIRNSREIKQMLLYVSSNIGTILSYKNIQAMIGAKSITTIKNYLDIMNDVFLFFKVDIFDYSVKKQIYNPSKIYCIDAALSNAVNFKFSLNIGHAYENIVFVELLRTGKEIFYWKSATGAEIDFVIKKGMQIETALQVAYSTASETTLSREINALQQVKTDLNPGALLLITDDEEYTKKVNRHTIHAIPIWKWLLHEFIG